VSAGIDHGRGWRQRSRAATATAVPRPDAFRRFYRLLRRTTNQELPDVYKGLRPLRQKGSVVDFLTHRMNKDSLQTLLTELDQVGARFLVIWLAIAVLAVIVVGSVALAAL
jgi:hypothetical protein